VDDRPRTLRLVVRLTRVSPTHHRFAFVCDDGSGESRELETKSCLFHDLLHFAVETEARLAHSFYGLLAAGARNEDLTMGSVAHAEIAVTECVVGPLTGLLKHDEPVEPFLAMLAGAFAALGVRLPQWLTAGFVARVRERMRRLEGHWRGTPFGKTMGLRFEVGGA
jgi:hypothetical protein